MKNHPNQKPAILELESKAWFRLCKVLFQFAIGLYVLFTIVIGWAIAAENRYIGDRNTPMSEQMYLESYSNVPLSQLQSKIAEKYQVYDWRPYEQYTNIGKLIMVVTGMNIVGGAFFWITSRAFLYVVAGKN